MCSIRMAHPKGSYSLETAGTVLFVSGPKGTGPFGLKIKSLKNQLYTGFSKLFYYAKDFRM